MKVLLAYDCLHAFLAQKGSNIDVAQAITLMKHMRASMYVDGYANLLLYLKGLLSDVNGHPIKGMFIIPPLSKENISNAISSDIVSYAERLDDENQYFWKKEDDTKEQKLFIHICRYSQLSHLKNQDVDVVISNDAILLTMAYAQALSSKIYSPENFIERIHIDHPEYSLLQDLKIKEVKFREINVHQSFFNSYREEYIEFNDWFEKKSLKGETAYIATMNAKVVAFLSLKVEKEDEDYSSITPQMLPNCRLKICSFKVGLCGYRLSERFMMIIFKEAIKQEVDEIYVTVFDTYENRRNLIRLLCERWGFIDFGKNTRGEHVLTRKFTKFVSEKYRQCYPFVKRPKFLYIVSLPPKDISEFQKGHIRQVMVLYQQYKELERGAMIFVRNSKNGKMIFPVIVEDVIRQFKTEQDFIDCCKKRSIYTEMKLRDLWNKSNQKPYILKILHIYDFSETDIALFQERMESMPKSERKVYVWEDFDKLVKNTQYEKDIIVD